MGSGNFPYPSIPNLCSEQLMKALMRPDSVNYPSMLPPFSPTLEETKAKIQAAMMEKTQLVSSQNTSVQSYPQQCPNQPAQGNPSGQEQAKNMNQPTVTAEKTKSESPVESGRPSQFTSAGHCNDEKVTSNSSNHTMEPNTFAKNSNQKPMEPPSQPSMLQPPLIDAQPHSDFGSLNGLLPYIDAPDWLPNPSALQATIPEVIDPSLPIMGQELWVQNQDMNNMRYSTEGDQFASYSQLSDETNNQSGIYGCIDLDVVNAGNAIIDASVSNAVLNNLPSSKEASLQYSSSCLVSNFSSSQDLQSQITTASLADSQAFLQDFPDTSGGTSSSNVDFDESSLLQNSWQQVVPPPMRTYTKVHYLHPAPMNA